MFSRAQWVVEHLYDDSLVVQHYVEGVAGFAVVELHSLMLW
jgi:hypothetical protein